MRASVRSYREHMADYAAMRALDVWYDTIDVDALPQGDGLDAERRERIRAAPRQGQDKNVPEFLFPKLAGHRGTVPTIKDDPPLIFHPTAELAPGLETNYREALARYRESLAEHLRTLFDRFTLRHRHEGRRRRQRRHPVRLALLMAADDDPLFLQVKEARPSVLEPYAGKSRYANHGERVVVGQRLMQSASDLFLGWTRGSSGRDFYVRQLRDMKVSASSRISTPATSGPTAGSAAGRWPARTPARATPP